VADYRLYFLDNAAHIRHALDLDFESDERAIAVVAQDYSDGQAMELWQRDRKVKNFPAIPKPI
jgi:hypothetical protein